MASSEIAGLTEDTTPDSTDNVYVQDAAGTVDKRVPLSALPVSTAAQAALDLKATATSVSDHLGDTTDAHDASAISVVSTTLVGTGTDAQAVFEELDNAIVAAETATSNHLADTSAAHAASAISADSTTLVGTGTDVQAVLEELDNGIADHLADTSAAHAASAVSFTATGTIAATDVQAAIAEVASEADTRLDALEAASSAAGAGGYWYVSGLGAGSGNAAANVTIIQTALDAADTAGGGSVQLPAGTWWINATLLVGIGVNLRGQGQTETIIKVTNSANLPAVIASKEWYNSSSASSVAACYVQDLQVDGNASNQASGTGYGVILMNYYGEIRNVKAVNTYGDAIGFARSRRDGTTLSNGLSEPIIEKCKVVNAGGHGFFTIDPSGSDRIADGKVRHNFVYGVGAVAGDSHAIALAHSGGFTVHDNHTYGFNGDHGIELLGCFATIVTENYVEHFGNSTGTSGTYAGIRCQGSSGRATIIAHNIIHCDEVETPEPALGVNVGHASSLFAGIYIQSGSSQDPHWVVEANTIESDGTACNAILVGRSSGGSNSGIIKGNECETAMTVPVRFVATADGSGMRVEGNVWQYATAAPSGGHHVVGEMVINTAAAVSAPPFFMCVTAGSPGTWADAADLV